MKKIVLVWILGISFLIGILSTALADADFLAPEKAFQFSAQRLDDNQVQVNFLIADGYYLYRERFQFFAQNATIKNIKFPDGKIKFDENFQKNVETYSHALRIILTINSTENFVLKVTSQGCSEKGLCYSPMESSALIKLATNQSHTSQHSSTIKESIQNLKNTINEKLNHPLSTSFSQKQFPLLLLAFFIFGIFLAFTPCVLPMLPILSSIIVNDLANQTNVNTSSQRWRGFYLSISYSLGMACIYTAMGIVAGLMGEGLAAYLQTPIVLWSFAIILFLLALSMFDYFQLMLPVSWQGSITKLAARAQKGKLSGVFIMGAFSGIMLSPCIVAPLAGTLIFISRTKDFIVGGSVLFVIAIGMSVPLILIGVSAGSYLPKTGAWMNAIKYLFACLLLAVAVWMVNPFISTIALITAWCLIVLGYGLFLIIRGKTIKIKLLGLSLLLASIIFWLVSNQSVYSNTSSKSMATTSISPTSLKHSIKFEDIHSLEKLQAILKNNKDQIVILDFYADWCVACIEMEKFVFSKPVIQNQLAQFKLLRMDVTKNNSDHRKTLKHFQLFGPPAILFFTAEKEMTQHRVIGYQNEDEFYKTLREVKAK